MLSSSTNITNKPGFKRSPPDPTPVNHAHGHAPHRYALITRCIYYSSFKRLTRGACAKAQGRARAHTVWDATPEWEVSLIGAHHTCDEQEGDDTRKSPLTPLAGLHSD